MTEPESKFMTWLAATIAGTLIFIGYFIPRDQPLHNRVGTIDGPYELPFVALFIIFAAYKAVVWWRRWKLQK